MAAVSFSNVTKEYTSDGIRAVDELNLEIDDGEFLVLVGPSGCGKSTALRMIAGLEEVTDGELAIGDRIVNEVPPGDRDIAMVFQNYALYPHMTVRDNIAFALQVAKLPKPEIRERTQKAAAMLGLTEYLDRLPKALSGGQRQRVAMGRAIVRSPQVFLMDEPLSNLDAKLRVQMRSEIIQIQKRLGTTMVYVTHDQIEAMTMGHRVAVMRKGILQQVAPPQRLYHEPANLFVAAFIGSPSMNLLTCFVGGTASHPVVEVAGHRIGIDARALDRYPRLADSMGEQVIVGIRPEHFAMAGDIDVPEDQHITVHVELAEAMGSEVHIHTPFAVPPVSVEGAPVNAEDEDQIDTSVTHVIARVEGVHVVENDSDARLAVKSHLFHFFDPASGQPLR
ncbi:MAG: sn-glycerol-3-phosphate ABC transporter ATP-binding protein UgpC [Ilumatobacteraceae bacterium]